MYMLCNSRENFGQLNLSIHRTEKTNVFPLLPKHALDLWWAASHPPLLFAFLDHCDVGAVLYQSHSE